MIDFDYYLEFDLVHLVHHQRAGRLTLLLPSAAVCQAATLLALTEVVEDGLELAAAHEEDGSMIREPVCGAAHPMQGAIGLERTLTECRGCGWNASGWSAPWRLQTVDGVGASAVLGLQRGADARHIVHGVTARDAPPRQSFLQTCA